MIADAAFELAREKGMEHAVLKNIAKAMGCSVQPVYSYYKNMNELKNCIYDKAMKFYQSYIYSRVDDNRLLESMGLANVLFARDETNLFKLLFLTEIDNLNSLSDVYDWMGDKSAAKQVEERYGLSQDGAKEVYIMLIVFTHGMANMIALGGAKISDEEIVEYIDKAYMSFVNSQKTIDEKS